jgi:hypothetical protein
MVDKIGGARQLTPIDPMGGPLKDSPDHGGGYMDNMSAPKVAVPAGGNVKSSQIDGPYGGKVKA